MGACGCADGGPDFKLAGPEGKWIGVTIYPGCDDCETPVGVEFDQLGWMPQEVIDSTPEVTFNKEGWAGIKILDAERLKEKLKEQGVDLYEDPEDPEGELSVSTRDLRLVLRLAVHGEAI